MLKKQSTTYEKSRRTSFIEDTSRTMTGNQYQHYWTIIKIKQQKYNSDPSRSILLWLKILKFE